MPTISFLPVLLASICGFFVGGLWYSPKLFGEVWNKEGGSPKKTGHSTPAYLISLAFSFVSAGAFAVYLEPAPSLSAAIQGALIVSVCWVATSFGINYQFAGRSPKLLAIDAGFHVLQFLVYAVILGLWH